MSTNVSEKCSHVLSCREETALFMSRLRANMFDIPKDDLPVIADLLTTTSTATKSALNSYSPMNSLPDEILALIFAVVPSELCDYETDWFDSPVLVTTDILPLTHVCRRWREVALSNQSLWTSINLTEETVPMGALFLERAGSSLLSCNVLETAEEGKIGDSFWISLLEDHSSHIRRLQVACCPLDFAYTFSVLEGLAMPELVECIIGDPRAVYFVEQYGIREFHLFSGLEHAPRLEKLTLRGVQGFPMGKFDILTHLSLYSLRGSAITNGGDMVEFLGLCPNLQHLIVEAPRFQNAPRSVSLGRLRTLMVRYSGSTANVSRILSSITLPLDVSVVISAMSIRASGFNFNIIRGFGLPLNTPNRVYFDITSESPVQISMVAATDFSATRIDNIPSIPSSDAELPYLPPSSVNELWIRIATGFNSSTMNALGNMFSSVETLVLHFEPPKRWLFQRPTDDLWGMKHTSIFPIHPSVSYVRICTWYGLIPSVIIDGLAARAQTGNHVAHLVIELPVWQEAKFTVSDLEQYADTVEVARTSSCTLMELPEVYRNRPHRQWPGWPEVPHVGTYIPWDGPVDCV